MSYHERVGFNNVSRNKSKILPPRIVKQYEVNTAGLDLDFSIGSQKYPTYREFMRLLPVLRDNPRRPFDTNDILGVFFNRKKENDRQIITRRIETAINDGLIHIVKRAESGKKSWLEYQLTDLGLSYAKAITEK